MLVLLLISLGQVPAPDCMPGGDKICSSGGYDSSAGINHGSGVPDFSCGHGDNLPDGGWGPYSKYCLVRTRESSAYNGWHGDLTISPLYPRWGGILLSVENSYFSPGFTIFAVDWQGSIHSNGRLYTTGNGAGVDNISHYVAVRGHSTTPHLIGDVMLAPTVEHHDGGWVVDVWNGPYETPFRVRDDGALKVGGMTLRFSDVGEGISIVRELPDGGVKSALVHWQ